MSPAETQASSPVKKHSILLVVAMSATFIVFRLVLHTWPNTDLNVGGYNLHHLFTGLLLIVVGGIPLAIVRLASRWLDVALVIFGIGLGMALDEWVFLIATDGSNTSYLLPVSLWGGALVVGLASLYALILMTVEHKRAGKSPRDR